jgi:hypothetical protein
MMNVKDIFAPSFGSHAKFVKYSVAGPKMWSHAGGGLVGEERIPINLSPFPGAAREQL